MKTRRDFLKLAGASLATVTGVASAAENPFGFAKMDDGYTQVADNHMEGKCGGMKKAPKEAEGSCGGMKTPKAAEGKCGEGKCGGSMKMSKETEGKVGGMKGPKETEGTCGSKKIIKENEGKCGANR
jgi:uncharacterized low-complexity protein